MSEKKSSRTKTSNKWLREHFDDVYVKRAQEQGWRSRAAFKLLEIQEKDKLFKPGMTVLDLGAAPGGWSQVAIKLVGSKGLVIASDILEMAPIAEVQFLQGDFREQEVYQQLLEIIGNRPVDLVISDMAPNMSGVTAVDHPRGMYLVELAQEMARQVLKKNGDFLVKVFQGPGIDQFRKGMQHDFQKLITRKPDASRARSKEVYLLGKGFKGI
ncbi:23S rRNA (uridine(2552)-2'-O)-methyltransferase RlmE [Ketobacter sp. MCCC 1A13808]|mgnify:CR=1 FL=1|uniref:23S rRNA (uridine(2552)-2'-O)-methyltransferase RlmE n=1 Tax=Ketobacter sp. MCCC 1A13808 TaxID=2602738 RepID=UPI0012EC8A83|nr:23S rRNA (uridine(2552)-2'-O)-methyltransferase RlmE [Ketobacter sp. MCCC 1A13808]MVF13000.1 23S rRNA (uridine(2552)-2'-O)-methyltransferase RlmE [Ketobacter sp. MCCC 1A13808]